MARQLCLMAAMLLSCIPLHSQIKFTFADYPTSGSPTSMAVADFDRDGAPDIAVSNFGTNTTASVDVYFNYSDGTFRPFVSTAVPKAATILAADFDGDSWPDIVGFGLNANQNFLLVNDMLGSFRQGAAPLTQFPVTRFVAGDFNGDGKIDIAAVEGTFGQPGQIEILRNTGFGTFRTSQILRLPNFTQSLVAYDFDGDGKLDIADVIAGKIQIWWGNGNGTFGPPLQIPSPSADALISIVNADFDSDAKEDFAVNTFHPCPDPTNFCGKNTVWAFKNLGNRRFKIVSSFNLGTGTGGFLYSADLNGDLKPDIIMTNFSVWVGALTYRLGKGNGTFGPVVEPTGLTAPDIAFRDLNRDTRTDISFVSVFPGQELDVLLVTNGFVGCASPGTASLAAHICTPASGAVVTNPVVFRASGDSPQGVRRLELWIDNVKRYQKLGNQMATSLFLARGKHLVTVVAVDQYTGFRKSTRTISVR